MGSVIDSIDCPNCGQQAITDFYYKTSEEYTTCGNCGYYKSITLKDRNKQLSELVEDDYRVIEINNPFGSYRLKSKGSIATQMGSLISEEDYEIIKKQVMDEEDKIEHFSISRYIDGKIVIETIIDIRNN